MKGFIALAFVAAFLTYGWFAAGDPHALLNRDSDGPRIFEDRHGNVLRAIPSSSGRPSRAAWVRLDNIASHAHLVLIASEDQRFYEHRGVDPYSILRAIWLDLRTRSMRFGGSTLTMQLARMLISLGKPRTWMQKIREAIVAWKIERAYSKARILEEYFNRAYYGHGAYGIEDAAQRYFGKPAASLSIGEATFLAVLPRGPSYYEPMRHRERALARRAHLIDQLIRDHLIDPAEADTALREPVRPSLHEPPFFAPHFVNWLLTELPSNARMQSGIVHTSLDLALQQTLEYRVAEHVKRLQHLGVTQAGVVVLDAPTSEVRAMVGSAGYQQSSGQINIATWRRYPGSALKPFVYATAIEHGENASSIAYDIADVRSSYQALGTHWKERGPVRYREALAGSYNLAAIHVLEKVGVSHVLEKLRLANAGELEGTSGDYGLRLAVGSAKVRLVDLAAAYGFLVRQGRVIEAHGVTHVEREDGSVHRYSAEEKHVFSPQASWITMDMLADPEARRPMFGDELPVDLPYRVAAKTGTARGFSDTYAVFATSEFIVAAWTGRFDGKSTEGVLGMEGAAPLARAALLAASHGARLSLPRQPYGIVTREVCPLSGALPSHACPQRKTDYFIRGNEPTRVCDWHAFEDSRVQVRYPHEARAWAQRNFPMASIR